jgi:hypothetical protein
MSHLQTKKRKTRLPFPTRFLLLLLIGFPVKKALSGFARCNLSALMSGQYVNKGRGRVRTTVLGSTEH